MSMLIPTLKRVCSCQCLEVAQPQSPFILQPLVCVLMSMLGGGATTIPTLKCVCALPMSMIGGGGPLGTIKEMRATESLRDPYRLLTFSLILCIGSKSSVVPLL